MTAAIFPPKPLTDLSPFGIKTPTETEAFLLALQRATAATLTVFLLYRYGSGLQDRLPHLPMPEISNLLILSGVGYCLSAPATNLGFGSCFLIKGTINILTPSKEKTVTSLAMNVLMLAVGYCVFHNYENKNFLINTSYAPNLLDRGFVAIAHRYSGPFYDYFFAK
jgi:hypothetical protein